MYKFGTVEFLAKPPFDFGVHEVVNELAFFES